MNTKKETQRASTGIWRVVIVVTVLCAFILLAWGVVVETDRQMRDEMLLQARLVSRSINRDRLLNLAGTESDVDNPDYIRLKEQLSLVRSANMNFRFLYLMGRRADGAIFFFVDSEPPDSKDYSPPGQVYGYSAYDDAIAADFLRTFEKDSSIVQGPATDDWGTWVSALVPIVNWQTGAVDAVLGIDIDASSWRKDIAIRA